MLASDDRNPEFLGASNPDRVLHVTFFRKTTPNAFRSEKEGHPIFQEEDWIRIMLPGRPDLMVEEPAEFHHRARFPQQWAHFKNQTADVEQVVGTPVTEWPAVTRAQAEELRGKKFYSVEQIAECSDAQIQTLGMNASVLRQKARAYLTSAKGSAIALELEQKAAENAELKARQEALEKQVADLVAAMAQNAAKPAKSAKPEKAARKPMSEENRRAAGERLAAARAAKKAKQEQPPAG